MFAVVSIHLFKEKTVSVVIPRNLKNHFKYLIRETKEKKSWIEAKVKMFLLVLVRPCLILYYLRKIACIDIKELRMLRVFTFSIQITSEMNM